MTTSAILNSDIPIHTVPYYTSPWRDEPRLKQAITLSRLNADVQMGMCACVHVHMLLHILELELLQLTRYANWIPRLIYVMFRFPSRLDGWVRSPGCCSARSFEVNSPTNQLNLSSTTIMRPKAPERIEWAREKKKKVIIIYLCRSAYSRKRNICHACTWVYTRRGIR